MRILFKISAVLALLLFLNSTSFAESTDWQEYQQYGHKSPKWDGFVQSGFSAFEVGNMGPAEMFLQRAVARGCNDGLVYLKIGLYYEALKNYKKAVDYFLKANKKLGSQYPTVEVTREINEYIGRAMFLDNQTDSAIPYLEKSLSQKKNFTALYFLAQIYKSKGDQKKAIDYFEDALDMERPKDLPKAVNVLIMMELGRAYYVLKDFDTSLEWWNKVLKIDPQNQTALSFKNEIEKSRFKEKERKIIEEIVK